MRKMIREYTPKQDESLTINHNSAKTTPIIKKDPRTVNANGFHRCSLKIQALRLRRNKIKEQKTSIRKTQEKSLTSPKIKMPIKTPTITFIAPNMILSCTNFLNGSFQLILPILINNLCVKNLFL